MKKVLGLMALLIIALPACKQLSCKKEEAHMRPMEPMVVEPQMPMPAEHK